MSEPRPSPRVATPASFNIFGADAIFAEVKFVGANAQGPQLTIDLPNVMFRPNNRLGLISDEWGQLQVTGEVLVDASGIFGTLSHPDSTLTSPLTDLYYIGKGVVSVKPAGGTAFRDVGNVPVFEFEPNVTTLPHYSSRLGVRSKDLEVIREKAAVLQMTMEEFSYDNLLIALLGQALVIP